MALPPVPPGQINFRDWAAIEAMGAMLGNDVTRRALGKRALELGIPMEDYLAQRAYEIAEAMRNARPT